MKMDGRAGIVDIDEEERVVVFDTYRLKKITGTRVAPILGMSEFSSPFKVACEMAGLYPGDKANKYIDAGNILEPVLRAYLSGSCDAKLRVPLGLADGSRVAVEEPVEKEMCGYDHFHNERVFGGMVDGYIVVDGKRSAILEIKTASDRTKWEDGEGGYTNVPFQYMLQASLYAKLSNLDRIVFLVGFLEEPDYDRPKQWVPTSENTYVVVKDRLDMDEYMDRCVKWYDEYMKGGYTPEWSDSEDDQAVLKYLKAYKPDAKKKRRRSRVGVHELPEAVRVARRQYVMARVVEDQGLARGDLLRHPQPVRQGDHQVLPPVDQQRGDPYRRCRLRGVVRVDGVELHHHLLGVLQLLRHLHDLAAGLQLLEDAGREAHGVDHHREALRRREAVGGHLRVAVEDVCGPRGPPQVRGDERERLEAVTVPYAEVLGDLRAHGPSEDVEPVYAEVIREGDDVVRQVVHGERPVVLGLP
ncbi:MAG: YqaJ viral recombinase family protein [Thermoplasmata archaeon]|nr:YqaJ viral recombinase family protein [Thermoplasmata archaeon]